MRLFQKGFLRDYWSMFLSYRMVSQRSYFQTEKYGTGYDREGYSCCDLSSSFRASSLSGR
jgi:hypothetical protein